MPKRVQSIILSYCSGYTAVGWIAISLILLIYPEVTVANERLAIRRALASIKSDEIKSHVGVLADDSFEGRESGRRGGLAAAKYLVGHMQDLQPGTRTGYVQQFGRGYRNVLGILPGSDEKLKNEYIVIGAHYDHVGYGNRTNSNGPIGYIHNGADDNASGTASLLELVEAFGTLPTAPRRSVIFAFWDGEEKGLLGSEHWASNPTVPFDGVKFLINMDMVGRLTDNRLEVYGYRSAVGLREILCYANLRPRLQLNLNWKIDENSDHHSFFRRQVPFLMFHTGLHDDYHTPRDDAHLINNEGIHRITELAFDTVYNLANLDQIPKVRTASKFETEAQKSKRESSLPQPRPRLGVSWRTDNVDGENTFVVTKVHFDGAAHRGGIEVGDRLLSFNDEPIETNPKFMADVLASSNPANITIRRANTEEPLQLSIDLDGKPSRLGISWNESEVEMGAVMVTRVVAGTPSDAAGIRVADRIWAINGKPFQNARQFHENVTSAELPIRFLIDRNGILDEKTVAAITNSQVADSELDD